MAIQEKEYSQRIMNSVDSAEGSYTFREQNFGEPNCEFLIFHLWRHGSHLKYDVIR